MDTVKLSMQDRVDNLAVAYVQSHFDVKDMSPEEFVKEVASAQIKIAEYFNNIKTVG